MFFKHAKFKNYVAMKAWSECSRNWLKPADVWQGGLLLKEAIVKPLHETMETLGCWGSRIMGSPLRKWCTVWSWLKREALCVIQVSELEG